MFDNVVLTHIVTFLLSVCIMISSIIRMLKDPKKTGWTITITTAMAHSIIFYIAVIHDEIFHSGLLYKTDFVVAWSATKNLHLYISLCIYFVGKAYAMRYTLNDTG